VRVREARLASRQAQGVTGDHRLLRRRRRRAPLRGRGAVRAPLPEGPVRAAVAFGAAVAAALVVGVAPAGATRECHGLQVCVPKAGPWVVVPIGGGAPRPQVEYRMTCPRHYVVGGLDAELSSRAIDVSFLGSLGSPVNPGISTSDSVVFVGSYVGASAAFASFRPHIGCLPGRGGGTRVPTARTT